MAELVRFVDERRGHRNIRAGYFLRTISKGREKGHWVIDCPEVGRELVVAPERVMKKKETN